MTFLPPTIQGEKYLSIIYKDKEQKLQNDQKGSDQKGSNQNQQKLQGQKHTGQ